MSRGLHGGGGCVSPRAEREIGAGETIWFATGTLGVTYVRPAPVRPVGLRARVDTAGERTTLVACELLSGDDVCARATVTAVRVSPAWLRA